MARRTAWIVLLGLLLLGVAPLAATEGASGMSVNGQVVSIDAKAGTVVVKADAESAAPRDVAFTVGPKTKILKDGKSAALADLKAGDKVTVDYESVSGKNMALIIGVVGTKAT